MANAPRIRSAPDNQASSSEIFDRQLPVDLRAEQGVLGSILLKPDVIDDIILILRAEDFFDNANRRLYENVTAMHDGGHKIDSTLLVDKLKTSGDFEAIGGAAYLGEIGQSVPNAAHAVYYANIVREKSTLRALIDASTGILQDAYEQAGEARELLNQAEQRIFSIVDRR